MLSATKELEIDRGTTKNYYLKLRNKATGLGIPLDNYTVQGYIKSHANANIPTATFTGSIEVDNIGNSTGGIFLELSSTESAKLVNPLYVYYFDLISPSNKKYRFLKGSIKVNL